MEGIIDCYKLDVARNIPGEFAVLESNYQTLKNSNQIISGALIGVGLGLGLFLIYKMYFDDKERG